jgi:DNA-binding FrmR family transcriptional regulator
MDISHQMMATRAVLDRANREVLSAHLKHCVKTADSEQEREEKIDELVDLLGKIMK